MQKMVDIGQIDIRTLIPQKDPFVMVDRLVSVADNSAVSSWTISQDAIFMEGNELLPCAILENMAQTCAAQLGYLENCLAGGGAVRIGFIGAVKNLRIYRTPKCGETVVTGIEIVTRVVDMMLVDAISEIDGEKIAEGQLKIALSDKIALK